MNFTSNNRINDLSLFVKLILLLYVCIIIVFIFMKYHGMGSIESDNIIFVY